MLDIRRLRLLLELERRGTITAAARAVNYTPSAVSQQLTALEREAGVALLERDGRRVRLTPAARVLTRRTDQIISDLEAAEMELAAGRVEPRGSVIAGAFPTAAERLLIPALAAVVKRYAAIEPAIRQVLPEEGIELLRSGELDVLVAKAYDHVPAPRSGGLERHHLLSEELLVALPVDHPLAGRPLALAELEEEKWIAGEPATVFGEVVRQACLVAGYEPQIVHRAEEVAVQLALVSGGAGVALVPRLGCSPPVAGVSLSPITRPRLERHVFALVRRGAERRPEIRTVLEALIDQAARASEELSLGS